MKRLSDHAYLVCMGLALLVPFVLWIAAEQFY